MLRKLMFIGLAMVFVATMTGTQVFTVDEKDLEKQADLIAKLLVSCRAIIAQHQDLINNPEIEEKGFTGDVYISKVIKHFKNATGIDVSESDASSSDTVKKALGTLLISAKAVIDESQMVINLKGMGFKNVIPAIVGKRSCYKFKNVMKAGYFIKQTSLKYRNISGQPDAFETKILKKFEESDYPKGKGVGAVIANSDGSKVYRYILPLYIETACLKCHGEPKGEKDIAGRIKEGYKVGEVRGGISVMIPYR